ncbi:MEDS domain-containing protein [Methanothermobacter sp. K4]|uniref:MEDS domain-containing protein n=1 Tax=Methanothermobacter sp. K4 TaxID=2913262 RepID=UPI001EDB948B|nr:MEDS domain-containing protein [Methanothermobacter sp. K4]MCG2828236.1 MEDS domain-containing protein [Methanothermobacter sp. K4]
MNLDEYRARWLSRLKLPDLNSMMGDMKRGDHLCLIYEDEEEWLDAVIPFIMHGVKAGERCIYISDEHSTDDVRRVLMNSIPDTPSLEASGQLIIKDRSVYAPSGVFEPEEMISLLESEVQRAIADGFHGLRVTGEATWILRDVEGSERIMEYEALLKDFFSENECIALCQYHRPCFRAETLKGVLLTHPFIVWKSRVQWNPYHLEHENAPVDVSEDLEVENWLRNIERESELIRTIENLEYIGESFIDNSPSIVFLKDSELRYIIVNQSFCESIGMERDDVIGKRDHDIMDADSARKCHESDMKAIENGLYHSEDVLGGRIYEVTKFSIELPDGGVGVGGYAVDVTPKRMYEMELESSRNNFMGVVEGSPDPIIIVDSEGVILYFNPAAEDYLSLNSIGETIGVPLKGDVQEIKIVSPEGSVKTAEMSVTEIKWESEDAMLIRLHDITRLREYERSLRDSLREKEVMLREIHHRVKNNLQIISSLLNLQRYRIDDEMVADVFMDSVNRVKSMAMIHEKLYQSENLADLPFSDYIVDLVSEIRSNYPEKRISVTYDIDKVHLDINRAIPAGLIVNEAVTNAMKHAFKSEGDLIIRLFLREGMVHVEVEDNGPGLPANFDTDTGGSLGMDLMRNLAAQLDGELRISGDDGVLVSLVFPL